MTKLFLETATKLWMSKNNKAVLVCIHRAEERGAVHEFDLIIACLNLTAVRSLNREAVCVTHRFFLKLNYYMEV